MNKFDHRHLGQQLELFTFNPLAPGAIFWLPKGFTLYRTLSNFIREKLERDDYQEVKTPLLFNKKLWEKSGHLDFYQDSMFLFNNGEEELGLKPMNCPGHMLLFADKLRSYRDLPWRLHEQSSLHRNELSGSLGGLTRVREFAQDDTHIFCTPSDISSEISRILKLLKEIYQIFNLKFELTLSTRNLQKFIGTQEIWDRAENDLKKSLETFSYGLKDGEAAFYGPKIDIDVVDNNDKKWQLGTIQLDFNLPQRFDLHYIGEDNTKHQPIVIHSAIFGSFERFIAILLESYQGKFPLWLAPIQINILTIAERHAEYAKQLQRQFVAGGFRTQVNDNNETIGSKIKNSHFNKIPCLIVIGDKEVESKTFVAKLFGENLPSFQNAESSISFLKERHENT